MNAFSSLPILSFWTTDKHSYVKITRTNNCHLRIGNGHPKPLNRTSGHRTRDRHLRHNGSTCSVIISILKSPWFKRHWLTNPTGSGPWQRTSLLAKVYIYAGEIPTSIFSLLYLERVMALFLFCLGYGPWRKKFMCVFHLYMYNLGP